MSHSETEKLESIVDLLIEKTDSFKTYDQWNKSGNRIKKGERGILYKGEYHFTSCQTWSSNTSKTNTGCVSGGDRNIMSEIKTSFSKGEKWHIRDVGHLNTFDAGEVMETEGYY